MYKILNKIVPNPGVTFKNSLRGGIFAIVPIVPTNSSSVLKKLKYYHFNFVGPKLFNILPPDLKQFSSDSDNITLAFKNKLDTFLSNIPDQPTIYGLQRQALTNSIIDQFYYMKK